MSRRTKMMGVAGIVLVVGLLGAKMLLGKKSPSSEYIPPPVHHAVTKTPAAVSQTTGDSGKKTVARPHVDPTLPPALKLALLNHKVVVAVLYAPDAPGDDSAVQAAREGAKGAHVGFAVLNVRNENVAKSIAVKLPGSSDPTVAVVSRPGTFKLVLNGYVDSQVVAQAARDAR